MTSRSIRSLKTITDKIKKTVAQAVKRTELTTVARFTIDLIVKRTRLGYGVDKQFGVKSRLKPLSRNYVKYRERYPGLSPTTTPKRSNLSLTGQMLNSMDIIRASDGKITFGPTGSRTGSFLTNLKVAEYQENQGRVFNRISALEFNQVLRFYRKQFGDLLKKRDLIR